jgi:tetratricopeptide (TPR) repeat protein
MSSIAPFKYRAFLSYAHADTGWAKWLHGRLEGFRIDKDLAGRETDVGPVPKTLRPIFRDREDFSGGHTLTEATVAALDDAAALVVLCSPVAATRPAVNEEARLFRWRHPERPVIPVIVAGTYPDNFPAALRFEVMPDGSVADRPVTFLAPDLREEGDGRELAVAKVVARLIGVTSDEVFRRAERARRRSANIRNGIIAALAVLVVVAGVSAYLFRAELMRNEALLEATLKTATEIVNTSVSQADKYNVPRTATVEMLTRAEALFENMARLGRATPAMQRQKALMLIEFARNYEILGDTTRQRQRAEAAHGIMTALAGTLDEATQHALSTAQNERGRLLVVLGNLPGALESFATSLEIRERLAKADPGNHGWQRDVSASLGQVGDVLRAQGNLPGALERSVASLAIAERLAKVDPGNPGWQRDLSLAHQRIGDVLRDQGNLPGALERHRAAFAIVDRLAREHPDNAGWQSGLSVAHQRIGEVLRDQGNLPGALERHRASLAIADRLAKDDPRNATWQRDLSVSHERIGDVLRDQGKLPGAMESYRAALEIRERLAKSDPGNAGWQSDLSVSLSQVGSVLRDQRNLAGALESYRASLAMAEMLARADPDNAGWQRDLSVAQGQVGEALRAQGNLPEALAIARASLALVERLAKADPSNSGWQRDLAVGLGRVAGILAQGGQSDEALAAFRRGRDIIAQLRAISPNTATLPRDLAWFDGEIARLVGK